MRSLILSSAIVALAAGGAHSQLFLSVADNTGNQLPGLSEFLDGDVAQTNQAGSYGSVFFSESNFSSSVDVDAFHLFDDGTMLLSVVFNNRTIGGNTFSDGDLIRYDPTSDTASVFAISETGIGDDLDAVSVAADGTILFSTGNATNNIGGTAVADGDILAFNQSTGGVSVLFTEAQIFDDGDGEISALHTFDDGTFLISAFNDESISGVNFANGDLVLWDSVNDTASLYFSEDNFLGSNSYNINAAFVIPAPGAAALAGTGFLAGLRRRRSRSLSLNF